SKIYHTFLPAFTLGLLGNLISDITYGFIDPRIRSN
ncbi:ABC transporter permease, partial [Staphylococcus aureus]|nr:ABC transporter permease [Staphylococcus aureus]MBR9094379.1 ABC transporter permease [Staphylococcus aureus]MBR9144279.1 ABC transporter permease [Staphylococcus aureus]